MSARWRVRHVGLATALFAALGIVLLSAAPAQAHAALLGTTPANGTELDAPPEELVIQFSERVSVAPDGVELRDRAGNRVETGPAEVDPATGAEVRLPVPADLPEDSYLVTFLVVSADSHPIGGAFAFSVGVPVEPVDVTDLPGTDPTLATAFTGSRWTGYAGLALLAGALVVFAVCWPGGWSHRRARRLVAAGWVASLVAATGVLLLQGPYAASRSLSAVTDPALVWTTLGTTYGRFVLVRLGLVLLAGALLLGATRPWALRWRAAAAVLLGVALPATWIGTGHTISAGGPHDFAANTAHLAAMAAWFGGLAVLAVCLLPRSAAVPVTELAAAVRRFSLLATGAVVTLTGTGVYIAWREVGSFDALAGTAYGRLLAFKLAAVGLLLWLGATSRTVVRRRYQDLDTLAEVTAGGAAAAAPTSRSRRRAGRSAVLDELRARAQLHHSVRLETGTGMLVLALVAVLVATPPGVTVTATAAPPPGPPEPVEAELELDDGTVFVQVAPATIGDNQVVVEVVTALDEPWDVPEVRAAFLLPEQELGPIPVELEPLDPGLFEAAGVPLPTPGTWRLDVTVRTSDIDSTTLRVDVPVT